MDTYFIIARKGNEPFQFVTAEDFPAFHLEDKLIDYRFRGTDVAKRAQRDLEEGGFEAYVLPAPTKEKPGHRTDRPNY
jgi:hypothetical protein